MAPVAALLQQAVQLHRQGRLAEAERAYSAALAQDPKSFDALRLFGMLRTQQGRLTEAAELVSAAVKRNPGSADALTLLGSIMISLGRAKDAVGCFDRAVVAQPRSADLRYNRAVALGLAGRPAQALADYDQVVGAEPNRADAWLNRGNVLAQLERYEEAIASYDRAVTAAPGLPDALNNRGNAFAALGRRGEALASFEAALAADPRHLDALNNRAIALKDAGRLDEALASCERALAIKSDHFDTLITRGNVLVKLGRAEDALASVERALAVRPDDPTALNNRGFALAALRRLPEAQACYDRALQLQPGFFDALNNRGIALFGMGRYSEAMASYDAALAAKPDHADVLVNRANVLAKLDRYAKAAADCRKALAVDPGHATALGSLAFNQLFACEWADAATLPARIDRAVSEGGALVHPFVYVALPVGPADHLRYTRAYVERTEVPAPSERWPQRAARAGTGDKIRIAYLSADFYRHPTGLLAAELFERHDRSRFEVHGISFGPDDGSDMRRRLIASFDRFHDVAAMSDRQAARLVQELGIDIALDLKGHTENARPAILAARPAPVQVSWLGYPGTMAVDFIDYLIADRIVVPPEHQPHYTEQIVYLPDCYQPNDATRPIAPQTPSRADLGLPERGFVFCCFNQNYKILPEYFDIWMRLLARVEHSVLWLLQSNADAAANLRREAQARGIDPSRLVFAPKLDQAAHLVRHRAADLFLDTLPCNAHTTASDALWAGLPVLTCAGDKFAGRVAASLAKAVGLPELAVSSAADYEALAFRLAGDRDLMQSLRQRLEHNRLSAPLFDTDRFRRHIEAAYGTMHEIWRSGDAPRGFSVEPLPS